MDYVKTLWQKNSGMNLSTISSKYKMKCARNLFLVQTIDKKVSWEKMCGFRRRLFKMWSGHKNHEQHFTENEILLAQRNEKKITKITERSAVFYRKIYILINQ